MSKQYQQTLDYLYTQLPMYQRIGSAAFKKDLTNITVLCKALGQPQKKYPSIHIAGTNGKGSTAHTLSAIFQAKGLKVGLYTSPHYRDFRERIKINGVYIAKKEIVAFVEQRKDLFEKIKPSFFEITVAMAFYHFAESKVDIAIIETGLGGRLDSTNIILPLLSVITNISFDHQQFLGDTLPLIAGEKAGIIKKNVPVIIGEEQQETKVVFKEKAKKMNAPITFANRTYRFELVNTSLHYSTYNIYRRGKLMHEKIPINIHGPFQQYNLATALTAIDCYNKLPNIDVVDSKTIKKGLKNLKTLSNFIGRWQIIDTKPTVLCDSAHNVGGLKIVLKQVKEIPYKKLHIVLGMVNDKSLDKVLKLFPKEARYYFAKANIPRGLDASILEEKAAAFGLKGRRYSTVKNALKAARRHAEEKDLIYVGGSTFVVAEVI